MSLTLYNTLTRKKEPFAPLDPENVRMYVCGPTVYDLAHIGNARPVIVFDVLYRLLIHLAGQGIWDGGRGETRVTYARNITDVDDKIIQRAAEEGVAIDDLTARTAKQFQVDVEALGCLPPTHEPRATQHIADMVAMIGRLIEKGCAYAAEGHVLFHVPAMPDYGRLARRSLDEMKAGARVEVAPYKRDPMDFVLWKPAADGEPGWDSPWGRGRPGWHIECSAMSAALLGETFDIHGGGIDLMFPHHENEVAQSRCAHGTEVMARWWMHNGFLQVEGQKMSKSLGNFVTVRDLLEGWHGYAWPGAALRFNMLRTRYREPLDWTYASLDESHGILWDWAGLLEDVVPGKVVPEGVAEALCDDLNTPSAVTELHRLRRIGDLAGLKAGLEFLGVATRRKDVERTPKGAAVDVPVSTLQLAGKAPTVHAPSHEQIDALIAARTEARKRRDFAEADRIRDELAAMGVQLKDAKDPKTGEMQTTWEFAR